MSRRKLTVWLLNLYRCRVAYTIANSNDDLQELFNGRNLIWVQQYPNHNQISVWSSIGNMGKGESDKCNTLQTWTEDGERRTNFRTRLKSRSEWRKKGTSISHLVNFGGDLPYVLKLITKTASFFVQSYGNCGRVNIQCQILIVTNIT